MFLRKLLHRAIYPARKPWGPAYWDPLAAFSVLAIVKILTFPVTLQVAYLEAVQDIESFCFGVLQECDKQIAVSQDLRRVHRH